MVGGVSTTQANVFKDHSVKKVERRWFRGRQSESRS